MIIRPLTPDFDWDEHMDLTVRSSGPMDEVAGRRQPGPDDAAEVLEVTAARGFPATDLAVPLLITDDPRPANSGRRELTVRAGRGRLSRYRTDQVSAPADPASPTGQPLALDSAFAATPFLLDGF